MNPGEIVHGLPFEEYLEVDALSKSKLARFAEAPILANYAKEATAAMAMGSLVHCAILEPDDLEKRYCPTDVDRRGTKAWTEAEEASDGRELIKRADMDKALGIRDAVQSHPTASELLNGCTTEVSAFWDDDLTGLACKARADVVNYRLRVLLDLKVTVSALPRRFASAMADFSYHWQDVFYSDGFEASGFQSDAFIFIAVGSEPPHLVGLYEIAPSHRVVARDQVAELMAKYARCRADGVWPGLPTEITQIDLPKWALTKEY